MAAYLEKLVQPERRDRAALKGGLKELCFLFGGNVNAGDIANAFEKLTGRKATADEMQEVARILAYAVPRDEKLLSQWPTDTACGPNALRAGSSEAEAVRTGPCEKSRRFDTGVGPRSLNV